MNKADEKHMHRCLELAKKGKGKVSPNPLVGCVIVQDGKVLAEGWHRQYGKEHAEVDALKNAQSSVQGTTLYVNLEPCCRWGKQPPCTDAIITAKIKRVVVGAWDSSNQGANILRNNGIKVDGPVLKEECRALNEEFFSRIETNTEHNG